MLFVAILAATNVEVILGFTPSVLGFTPSVCVTVDVEDCIGGTMNLTMAKSNPRFWMNPRTDKGKKEQVVVDMDKDTWTCCRDVAVSSGCPTYTVNPARTAVPELVAMLLLFGILFLLCCWPNQSRVLDARLPDAPWLAVTLFWLNDFWVALSVSLIILGVPLDGCSTNPCIKIIASFIATLVFWDLVVAIFKQCTCRWPIIFFTFLSFYGVMFVRVAIARAYDPVRIPVVGHHAIVFGMLNFSLGLPKAVVKTRFSRLLCGSTTGYLMGWTELLKPLENLYPREAAKISEPLLGAITGP